MADFVAVLRKTLEGLGDPDPALRARVYDKARATVAGKLAALNPPPAPGVAERQQRSLEDAIALVERGYAKAGTAAADPLAELENVFASLKNPQPKPIAPRPPTAPVQRPADEMRGDANGDVQAGKMLPSPEEQPVHEDEDPAFDQDLPGAEPDRYEWPDEDELPEESPPLLSAASGEAIFAPPLRSASRSEETIDHRGFDRRVAEPPRRRGIGRFLAAAVVLAMLAGGAFGIWLNKDAFGDLLGLFSSETAEIAAVPATPEPAPAETPVPAETPAPAEPAAPAPAPAPGAAVAPGPAAPAPAEAGKLTQRLTPEGAEIDPGPAGGESGVGEGTSVAALTQPPAQTPPTAEAGAPTLDEPADGETAAAAGTGEEAAAPEAAGPAVATDAGSEAAAATEAASPAPEATTAEPAVAAAGPADSSPRVVQKAIFYEERTSTAEGSAEPGSIVWSLVQESPGSNLPPEPAIRAEATIPGKDVQLRMTIKRNADKSLPASHIIEMIFLTPEGFEGGGIENILRVAMKSSEQEAGNPLIGIPAKIADGFFLVALTDTSAEIQANLALLGRQSWIDVPLVYKSGRRALLTMEKGAPGDKVFEEALKAWQAATAG